jgi:hypothetical protein
MAAKLNQSSTEFEKHPDPRIEAAREAYRQKWGFNPPMPHVTLVPPELRVYPSEQPEKPETTADVLK